MAKKRKVEERPSIHEELQTTAQNWFTAGKNLKRAVKKQISKQMKDPKAVRMRSRRLVRK